MHLHQSKAQFCSLLCWNWFIIQWISAYLIIKQMALSLIVPSTVFSVRACIRTWAPQASWMCRTISSWQWRNRSGGNWLPFGCTTMNYATCGLRHCFCQQNCTTEGSSGPSVSLVQRLLRSDAVFAANGVRVWMLGGRYLSVSVLQA